MDGNGRWAEQHGNDRIDGRSPGEAVRSTVEGAGEAGVSYLTFLYAFSTENWNRPKAEVDALMSLLVSAIVSETEHLNAKNVRLLAIGNLESLPTEALVKLNEAMALTSSNNGLKLILALSYSGRWEITDAVKRIVDDISKR